MNDGLVKCDRCGLIVAKSMMEYHKKSECFMKQLGTLAGYDRDE